MKALNKYIQQISFKAAQLSEEEAKADWGQCVRVLQTLNKNDKIMQYLFLHHYD